MWQSYWEEKRIGSNFQVVIAKNSDIGLLRRVPSSLYSETGAFFWKYLIHISSRATDMGDSTTLFKHASKPSKPKFLLDHIQPTLQPDHIKVSLLTSALLAQSPKTPIIELTTLVSMARHAGY